VLSGVADVLSAILFIPDPFRRLMRSSAQRQNLFFLKFFLAAQVHPNRLPNIQDGDDAMSSIHYWKNPGGILEDD
jgi:hypothetical protein